MLVLDACCWRVATISVYNGHKIWTVESDSVWQVALGNR